MERATSACCHCGRAYHGRGIYADHGLAGHNLEKHQGACLDQQRRAEIRASRGRQRAAMKYRRRLEAIARKHGTVAPLAGQYGFPFEGVPAIVA